MTLVPLHTKGSENLELCHETVEAENQLETAKLKLITISEEGQYGAQSAEVAQQVRQHL